MKKIVLFLLTGAISFNISAQTPAQEIDEMMKQYAKQNSFNGVVLVAQKENVLLQKGYGYKNIAARTLNDTNTAFQIGSLTKHSLQQLSFNYRNNIRFPCRINYQSIFLIIHMVIALLLKIC